MRDPNTGPDLCHNCIPAAHTCFCLPCPAAAQAVAAAERAAAASAALPTLEAAKRAAAARRDFQVRALLNYVVCSPCLKTCIHKLWDQTDPSMQACAKCGGEVRPDVWAYCLNGRKSHFITINARCASGRENAMKCAGDAKGVVAQRKSS